MDYLRIHEHREGTLGVLTVTGELDYFSGTLVEEEVARLGEAGCHRIVLDLSRLGFCDGHGIRVLLACQAKLRVQGGWLRLARADWRVREVLVLIPESHLLEVFETVAAAAAGIPLPPPEPG